MTKDFKTSTVTQPNVAQYGMSWMFGGIAIGLIVGLFVYIVINKDIDAVPTPTEAQADTNAMSSSAPQETALMQGNASNATGQSDTQVQPNFSYHAVLPQLDVPVAITPDTSKPAKQLSNSAETKAAKEASPAATTKLGKFNAFQVGSYKTQAQASAMQARLKQNGLATHIEKAEVNGQDYYRIKLGPATSADVYNKWQQTLSSMGINPLPIHL
jgi:cell division protein FtsN